MENRDRLHKYFVKIGSNFGEGIPAAQRQPYRTFGSSTGMLKWGDATSYQGFYLVLLATEYKLLSDENLDTKGTLNELYYAIEAINRLDGWAEKYISKDPQRAEELNGWYLRDDIPQDFINNFQSNGARMNFIDGDFFDSEYKSPTDPASSFFNDGNEPSWDQTAMLFMGFSFVKKYIPADLFIKPTTSDRGFKPVDEVKLITERIIDYLTMSKDYKGSSTVSQRNWCFANPVTGYKVKSGADDFMYKEAYPLAKIAEYITGNDYMDKDLWETDFFNVTTTVPMLRSRHPLFLQQTLDEQWADLVDGVGIIAGNQTIDNLQKFMNLAVFSQTLPRRNNSSVWQNNIAWLSDELDLPIYPLMYDVFHDETPDATDRGRYLDLLNSMPDCEGSYNFNTDNSGVSLHGSGPNNWAKAMRWQHPEQATVSNGEYGNFSSIDFMVLYNLFHIKYKAEISLPKYSPEVICPCQTELFPEVDVETCNIPNSYINYSLTIPKYPFNYHNIDIRLSKYIILDAYLEDINGQLHVQENVKSCANTVIDVRNSGLLQIENSGNTHDPILTISKGCSLTIGSDGILKIENNCKVIIEEGATLIIEPNSSIILEGENSILELHGDLHLENDAVFQFTGPGFVRFNMMNIQPTPHITAGNNCQIVFENGNIEKRVEISSNSNVIIPDNLLLFKLSEVIVECGQSSGFKIGCPVVIERSMFNKIPAISSIYVHNPLVFYGQSGIKVWQCGFNNALVAVKNYQNIKGKKMGVYYSQFNNCFSAIETSGGGGYFVGNKFTGNISNYIEPKAFSYSIFEHNLFDNSISGRLSVNGTLAPQIGFMGNLFLNNGSTIYSDSRAYLFFTCNQFKNNNENGRFKGETHFNASTHTPFTMRMNDGSIVPSGRNIFTTGVSNYQKGILLYDNTQYRFDDGYNYFNNTYTTLPFYYSIYSSLNRSHVLPSNVFQPSPDINFNNNAWTQTPIGFPLQNILDVNQNTQYKHFNLNFSNSGLVDIYGATKISSISTCPISQWNDAMGNPSNFNYAAIITPNLLGSFYKSSTLTPGNGDNGFYFDALLPQSPTTVTSGTYAGQPFSSAVATALKSAYNGGENSDGLDINLEALTNVNYLAVTMNSVSSSDDRQIWDYLYNNYLTLLGESIYSGDFNDNITLANTHLTSAINLINLSLSNNEILNSNNANLLYSKRKAYNYDIANTYMAFKNYEEGLNTLNNMYTFIEQKDIPLLDVVNCISTNEKLLLDNQISRLQFEENTSACVLDYNNYVGIELESTPDSTGSDTISAIPTTTPSFIISPNPALSQITVEINLPYDGDVTISIFDSYGTQVNPTIQLGNLTVGQYSTNISITELIAGTYQLIVNINGIAYNQQFIKLTE